MKAKIPLLNRRILDPLVKCSSKELAERLEKIINELGKPVRESQRIRLETIGARVGGELLQRYEQQSQRTERAKENRNAYRRWYNDDDNVPVLGTDS